MLFLFLKTVKNYKVTSLYICLFCRNYKFGLKLSELIIFKPG